MLHSLLTFTSFSHMYADFKLKFNLQCLLFEHFRYDHSSVLIQPLRSHRLDPARPMSMHGPLHGCSARPNLEAEERSRVWFLFQVRVCVKRQINVFSPSVACGVCSNAFDGRTLGRYDCGLCICLDVS